MLREREQSGVAVLATSALSECATGLLHVSVMRALDLVYKTPKLSRALASVDLPSLNEIL